MLKMNVNALQVNIDRYPHSLDIDCEKENVGNTYLQYIKSRKRLDTHMKYNNITRLVTRKMKLETICYRERQDDIFQIVL